MEIKSLQTVRDTGAGKFTKRIVFQKGGSVAFVLNFLPGQGLPPHNHPGSVMHLLVLEGSGTVEADGVTTEVFREDAVCCEGDERFSFRNNGAEPASLYVVLSKIPDERYAREI